MIEDYAKHAVVWDWDGYDNSQEYEYWCNYASRYGKKVLIPMCALGQIGFYMAEKGFKVTAFDLTKEMIDESRKRFGNNMNLSLNVADICDFEFEEKEFDFAFLATQDLHLLNNIQMVERAFLSIASHLRKGACFALELVFPSKESFDNPLRTFHPRVPNYKDKKVWKDSKNRYDAESKKHFIDQIVYVEDNKGIDSFEHSIVLQYFEHEEILNALKNSGFAVMGQYKNRNKEPLNDYSGDLIIEAVKY